MFNRFFKKRKKNLLHNVGHYSELGHFISLLNELIK